MRPEHTCDSLPTPLTGFRSVWPSALTASTATSSASTTAASGSYTRMCSSGVMTAVQKAAERARPPAHQYVLIFWHGRPEATLFVSWTASLSLHVGKPPVRQAMLGTGTGGASSAAAGR